MKTFVLFAIAVLFQRFPAIAQDLPQPLQDNDFIAVNLDEAKLGQLLFYDPILSGNKETACATCHHPALGTSDGVSLSFGDGGIGLGPKRIPNPKKYARRAYSEKIPPCCLIWEHMNLRYCFMMVALKLIHRPPRVFARRWARICWAGFTSILSAQTMFPVLSRDEMAGSFKENEIGRLIRQGIITGEGGAWDVLSMRVAEIPEYADQFRTLYPHITDPEDIAFTDIF